MTPHLWLYQLLLAAVVLLCLILISCLIVRENGCALQGGMAPGASHAVPALFSR